MHPGGAYPAFQVKDIPFRQLQGVAGVPQYQPGAGRGRAHTAGTGPGYGGGQPGVHISFQHKGHMIHLVDVLAERNVAGQKQNLAVGA